MQYFISIHAPSRERPSNCRNYVASMADFNPRSLTGATPEPCKGQTLRGFQSTLPHGSDIRRLIELLLFRRFQSTLPRGSDNKIILLADNGVISIHAPSRERRLYSLACFARNYFNPRSLAGATILVFWRF